MIKSRFISLLVGLLVTPIVIAVPQGVHWGRLAKCEDKPNCVNTHDVGTSYYVAPIPFRKGTQSKEIMASISQVVQTQKNIKVHVVQSDYLCAEFMTDWGWVDDVEFFIDDDSNLIHFRSQSRSGYSDFGGNKRRFEKLAKEISLVSPFVN